MWDGPEQAFGKALVPEAPPEAERAPPEAVPQLTDALGSFKISKIL